MHLRDNLCSFGVTPLRAQGPGSFVFMTPLYWSTQPYCVTFGVLRYEKRNSITRDAVAQEANSLGKFLPRANKVPRIRDSVFGALAIQSLGVGILQW